MADSGNGSVDSGRSAAIERRLLFGLLIAMLVQAVFVFSYVGALHSPTPHGVALGVVGSPAMPAAVGKSFSLKTVSYPSQAAALHAIDERKVVGAVVVRPAGVRLFVVPAAGPSAASALGAAFGAAAVAFHQKIEIVQVHPLPKGDAAGIVSFLLTMALVVGGYLTATMAMVFGGSSAPRGRAAALCVVAVLGALVTVTIAGPVIGAIPDSKFLALWALFVLVMAAVALATAALQTLLGPPGTLIVVVVFVIFGAPAAGGSVPSAFLPGFWRTIRSVPARGRRNDGHPEHALLPRQRHHSRTHRPHGVSPRRRRRHGHRSQTAVGEPAGGRGRGGRRSRGLGRRDVATI